MLGHVCSLHCTFVVLSSVAPQHRSHSAWIQLACKLYAYLCWNNRKFTLVHDGAPITLFFFFGLPARFNKELQLFVLNSKFVDTDNVDSSTKFTVKNESPSNSLFLLEPHYLTFLFTIFFLFLCLTHCIGPPWNRSFSLAIVGAQKLVCICAPTRLRRHQYVY